VFFSFSAQVHVFPHIVPKIPTIPDFWFLISISFIPQTTVLFLGFLPQLWSRMTSCRTWRRMQGSPHASPFFEITMLYYFQSMSSLSCFIYFVQLV
jgi:hypothetical protein